jgi:hypothetical protein
MDIEKTSTMKDQRAIRIGGRGEGAQKRKALAIRGIRRGLLGN